MVLKNTLSLDNNRSIKIKIDETKGTIDKQIKQIKKLQENLSILDVLISGKIGLDNYIAINDDTFQLDIVQSGPHNSHSISISKDHSDKSQSSSINSVLMKMKTDQITQSLLQNYREK